MAEKSQTSNERTELMKQQPSFMNEDNKYVPRTQSTPIQPPKKRLLNLTAKEFTLPGNADKPSTTTFQPQGTEQAQPNLNEFSSQETGNNKQNNTPLSINTSQPFVQKNTTDTSTPVLTSTTSISGGQTDSSTTPVGTQEKKRRPLKLNTNSKAFDVNKEGNSTISIESKKEIPSNQPAIGEWGKGIKKPAEDKATKSPIKTKSEGSKGKPDDTKIDHKEEPAPIKTEAKQPSKIEEKVVKNDVPVSKDIPKENNQPISNTKEAQPTVEQHFAKPNQKEVTFEIIVLLRPELEEALTKIREAQKDKPLPEAIQKIKDREIVTEVFESMRRTEKKQTVKKDGPQITLERGSLTKSQSKVMENRGFGIQRSEMTEEERRKKEELQANVGKWTKSIKATDPDEIAKKNLKLNLNIITPDNFDIIKEEILKIASEKFEYTQRVADLIIENAWTQKHYANTYAKLCDFLGKSDKLFFEQPKDKKKNDFKLYIMKKIQGVFEDESNIAVNTTKKVEDMTPEEKSEFYNKKKQKIIGNVCFIGELFLEKFIVLGVVRIITNTLLQKFLDEYSQYQKTNPANRPTNKSHEDTIEGLIKFYELIGKTFEDKEATKQPDRAKSTAMVQNFENILLLADSEIPFDGEDSLPRLGSDEISLDDLFKIFDIILNKATLSTRINSLIKNLAHRRDNKWTAPLYKNQGPKKIKEIYEEFEREQDEIERRANEYYQEEISHGRSYRKEKQASRESYSFQVTYEAKSKPSTSTEESKYDLGDVKADESVSFKPQRGKQDNKDKGAKKMQISHEELEKEIRDVYTLISEEGLDGNKDKIVEEIRKIYDRTNGRELMMGYFRTFYDGKISDVNKRLTLPNIIVENKFSTFEDFNKGLEVSMSKMVEIGCDFPNAAESFAVLVLEFTKQYPGKVQLSNIHIPEEYCEGEDAEFMLEFYQDFLKKLIKKLETNYSDLKSSFADDEISNFANKIKLKDLNE